MPPNFLVVVLDTARADAFEPYGARPGTTPTVAQLAQEGTAHCFQTFSSRAWLLEFPTWGNVQPLPVSLPWMTGKLLEHSP